MILCLAAAHASIFNTPRQAFLIKSAREAYQQTFLASFYLILLHVSYLILIVFHHEFNFYYLFAFCMIPQLAFFLHVEVIVND